MTAYPVPSRLRVEQSAASTRVHAFDEGSRFVVLSSLVDQGKIEVVEFTTLQATVQVVTNPPVWPKVTPKAKAQGIVIGNKVKIGPKQKTVALDKGKLVQSIRTPLKEVQGARF